MRKLVNLKSQLFILGIFCSALFTSCNSEEGINETL